MKNLFVGNLNFQTGESELTDLFKGFGQVSRVAHRDGSRNGPRARFSRSWKCRMMRKPQPPSPD